MKKVKYLEISLQHEEDVKKAIKFNIEHNFEYVIVDYNNLINYNNLALLLRFGYELCYYSDFVKLKHENYNVAIEEMENKEVQK